MSSIDCIDEIEIDASVERVFETVKDYPSWTQWNPAYKCQLLNTQDVVEGSEIRHQYGDNPLLRSVFIRRIDKIEAPSKLEESYISGPIIGKGTWHIKESNGRTTVAFHCQVKGNNALSKLVFKLTGDRTHKSVYAEILRKLKNFCEH